MRAYSELERVVCAGAISESFRRQLLTDPSKALQVGYMGQPFRLTNEEMRFLAGLQARDFQEFASQVSAWLQSQLGPTRDERSLPSYLGPRYNVSLT